MSSQYIDVNMNLVFAVSVRDAIQKWGNMEYPVGGWELMDKWTVGDGRRTDGR